MSANLNMSGILFTEMTAGDYNTYPNSSGQYLIKYIYNNLCYYMICYFWNNKVDILTGKTLFGFYLDETCEADMNIEKEWGYIPYAYYKLPNITNEKS